MKKESINKKVVEVVKRISGTDKVLIKHSLIDDIGMDSLKMVTLIVTVEEEFDIELSESDMNPYDLKTVSDIVRLVEKYCGGKA